MNARITAILVVLLAVLGGGALYYYNQERARRPANVGTLGQTLFKDLKIAEVAAIRIVEPKATLTLERKQDGWTIAERGGFPADVARVRDFLIKAIGLKVGQSEPIGEKDRARLNLDASGTVVELNGADGKPLARLTAGKKYFKREVENPDRAPGDGRFVALPGNENTVYLVSDPLPEASASSAQWIDRSSFKVEKVKTLEVRYPGNGGWRIERSGDNADWKLANAKPGEKLDISRANAASYTLSLLELADVAPKDIKETGLDNSTVIEATTLDGLAYSIKVGKLQGDNHYVSFKSSGTPKADEKDAERIKALNERLPREKLLSEHVLLISKSKLEDTLKKRPELLEQKDSKK
jgi:Domain of unknown function (DUF4340)